MPYCGTLRVAAAETASAGTAKVPAAGLTLAKAAGEDVGKVRSGLISPRVTAAARATLRTLAVAAASQGNSGSGSTCTAVADGR